MRGRACEPREDGTGRPRGMRLNNQAPFVERAKDKTLLLANDIVPSSCMLGCTIAPPVISRHFASLQASEVSGHS